MKRRVIRWEDPPHSRQLGGGAGRPPNSEWDLVAIDLRDFEPGRWAVVHEGDRSSAMWARSKIAYGHAACFQPRGAFQAAVRSDGEGTWTVYARYVGGQR